MKAARAAWPRRRRRAGGRGGAGRLVFLDETGARTGLCRDHGRALRGERARGERARGERARGERARAARPFGGWRSVTLVSAVRASGVAGRLAFAGALDADAFCTFLERVLLPGLVPGDVLVMDNLVVHKTRRARGLIEAAGVKPLFLPPYSPDPTPIENVFAKVKAGVRSAATATVSGLFDAFADALQAVTAEDLRGCFRACGIRV